VAYGSNDRFAAQLFGLGKDADPHAALQRLDRLWSQLDRSGKDFQQSYGEIPRDHPD